MKDSVTSAHENAGGTASRKPGLALGTLWQSSGTLAILLLLLAICSVLSPQFFLTKDNLVQVLLQSSVMILLACGVFFTILIAGIDLSVGSMLALTGMVTAQLMVAGCPPWLAVLLGGVLLGALLGVVNGFLVNVTQLHPFIITLGMMAIYRGLTLIISDARSVFGFPVGFSNVLAGRVLGIPVPVLVAIAVAGFLHFLASYTRLGRNIYALGGNAQAAWFSGINIKLHTLVVFVISGVCSGIAGVLTVARTGAAEPNAGTGFETLAIASAIIGGTSFFGGRGRVTGVVVGGLIIGVISNILNIMNVQSYYQQIVMGALIIGTVTADKIFGKKK
ncbi:D-allose ABC transporter permease [Verminephrobacter aporrectodeae subsp. tuberculatae]|uniref:D-allose ABC transporter permease n=1 Tax=Verminephrobacter aporrectodeae TaxID=1110389 RepID=UPI00224395B6|nr:D-allose ABC transporter permease [Verminephrobacter aporrectodeae]MCW8199940.1 D-allose ABC transporter permease [Verminephrobacter aporrectodeae subsp. tuberculatae]